MARLRAQKPMICPTLPRKRAVGVKSGAGRAGPTSGGGNGGGVDCRPPLAGGEGAALEYGQELESLQTSIRYPALLREIGKTGCT